ncbi:putative Membrane-bound lytic murein transglycosylase B-like protein [uncultured delta proteobacterium]|uniref:Putative Membrane-bound lytic murein transglycosylase B-like protein n=1 Tax=uncultured delta proteobacterium TaxID=34034 RepID=A0A212JL87_9DELT|nr:putative Membrane-bound lytic murein transglycosylase B-like protein [uncultured delta proteobacterium]
MLSLFFHHAGLRRVFSLKRLAAFGVVSVVLLCASVCAVPAFAASAGEGGATVAPRADQGADKGKAAAAPAVSAAKTDAKSAVKNTAQPSATVKKKTAPARKKTVANTAGSSKKTAPAKAGAASPPPAKGAAKTVKPAATANPAKPAGKSAANAASAPTEKPAAPPKFPAAMVMPVSPQKDARLPVAETWAPLVKRLHKDGIDMAYLRSMFGRMGDAYSHEPMGAKITELFTNKYVAKPPRTTPIPKSDTPPVYKSMVKPESVAKCKVYLATHAAAFAVMEERYGVPKEVVAGLLMVETRLGTFLGYNSSFWSLACMAAADTPERVEAAVQAFPLPMTPDKEEWLQKILRERSAWAYKELLALIKHSAANDLDPLCMPGSVYGAIGICQFMPSNLPKFAVDGNNDGKIDLFDPADAIPSVGNYLKEHGWSGKELEEKSRSGHHAALKCYNKSNIYANTILALAGAIVAPPETLTADAGAASGKTVSPKAKGAEKAAPKAAVDAGKKAPAKSAAKPAAKPAAKTAPKKAAPKTAPKAGQNPAAPAAAKNAPQPSGK